MSTLEGAEICEGLTKDEHANAMCEDPSPSGSSSLMRHTIPLKESIMKRMVHHFRLMFSSGLKTVSCFAMTVCVQVA
jgi:hypothetical protein